MSKQPTKKQVRLAKYLKLLPSLCLAISCMVGNAQTFDWAKGMGGRSADYGFGVAVDGSGNVYVTGYFLSDTVDFNPGGSGGMLISAGNADVFLAKYDAAGNYIWGKNMGGRGGDYGRGVAVDGSGNVYVTGRFLSDTADFNPGGNGGAITNAGGYDGFLAKYDTGGNYIWAKSIGGRRDDEGWAVTADGNGNLYVTGGFSATADFNPGGSGDTLMAVGGTDVFLARYDTGGNYLWAKSMGSNSTDRGQSLVVDTSGNVYVTGTFSSTANFNSGGSGDTLKSAGGLDIFVAKYDAGGNFFWAKSMGGKGADYGYGVVVDGSGNVYVTGVFYSDTADFNPGGSGGKLISAGDQDGFLARYDAGGNYLWAKNIGGSGRDWGYGIAMDGSDNVCVTGTFSGTADFNPGGSGGELMSAGGQDVFLARYDTGGSYLWAKNMGGIGGDEGWGVAVDGSGNVYGTGRFSDTADFNPGGSNGMLKTAGSADVFVVKFACSDTSSSYLTASLPCGESYTLNDSVYTATGTYTQIFPNISGCDSTVILDLTILPLDKPVITTDSFTLGTTGTYDTYQWLLNGEPIAGATDSTYTVTENGDYQVVVTNENGCSETSDVYTVTNYTGIEDIPALANQIRVYPNPATDIVHIYSPVKVNVALTDMAGKLIREVEADSRSLSLEGLAEGVYLLRIADKDGLLIKTEKIIKR